MKRVNTIKHNNLFIASKNVDLYKRPQRDI